MLLAFDLDNTIVTGDYRLTDVTLAAIKAAQRKGHLVTVITGRSETTARSYLEQLELKGLYGTHHGAHVTDAAGGVLFRTELESLLVRQLLTRYQRNGVECSFSVRETLYVRDPESDTWAWTRHFDHRLLPHTDYCDESPEKIVIKCQSGACEIHRDLSQQHPDLTYYLWADHALEITGKHGHKGAALKLLAETLGVPQSETVAFGDGLNDISMVQWAGHGVAVGASAHPEVVAAAAERVPSPEEHGVAEWLERNLL